MKAAVRHSFGPPEVITIEEVDRPVPGDDGILVRVRASSVNKADWYELTGTPMVARFEMGLRRPKTPRLGSDYAGTVEEVGKDVTDFSPGDEVYGGIGGAFAEYVVVKKSIARKPATLTFEEAAAVPTAAVTALQGLRDHGGLKPGQNVLVNGASGGVGTFAVQIAKANGAEVTAVCSTRNVQMVQALGADHVIDYTREDFTKSGHLYDLMLDVAGSRKWSEVRRVLVPEATDVIVGAPSGGRLLGPLTFIVRTRLGSMTTNRKTAFFIARYDRSDFEILTEMIESGQVHPVVDRRNQLSEIADALGHMGEGHSRAKTVIVI